MSFAILRIQKLKSFADVGGSLSHNYRNRETLNADDARTHLNEHALDTNEKCMTAIRDRIPEKRRKDAVLSIEHLITASPEWDGWGTEKETAFLSSRKNGLKINMVKIMSSAPPFTVMKQPLTLSPTLFQWTKKRGD